MNATWVRVMNVVVTKRAEAGFFFVCFANSHCSITWAHFTSTWSTLRFNCPGSFVAVLECSCPPMISLPHLIPALEKEGDWHDQYLDGTMPNQIVVASARACFHARHLFQLVGCRGRNRAEKHT